MAYKALTSAGIDFIGNICDKNNNLLKGKNKYMLPYSKPQLEVVWSCNITGVTTNNELKKALIGWFKKYSEMYKLDANVIAAFLPVELIVGAVSI